MSGVYIPDMEMPEACSSCWVPCTVPFEDRKVLSRASNCPLVAVPDYKTAADAIGYALLLSFANTIIQKQSSKNDLPEFKKLRGEEDHTNGTK